MPASAQPPAASAPTLASRPLPERVRSLLGGILEYASDELERVLVSTLNEFEQQLFKYAEQARSNMVQTRWLEAQRLVKRTRPDLVPRFLILLEAELACVKDPPGQRTAVGGFRGGGELSLVENVELDEATVLTEIAGRAEVRNSLPLYLLGQRFGVLAGKPAFDAENLPIGPQALCRMIRQASECLELGSEHRLLLFRTFERHLMPLYGSFVESLNTYLARNGVLPNLQYVPVRVRPGSQAPAAATPPPRRPGGRGGSEDDGAIGLAGAETRSEGRGGGGGAGLGGGGAGLGGGGAGGGATRAGTGAARAAAPGGGSTGAGAAAATGGVASGGLPGGDAAQDAFTQMRQLLAGRRQLLGKLSGSRSVGDAGVQVATDLVQHALGVLQHKAPATVVVNGKPAPRTVNHLKQDLLAQLRGAVPDGQAPALAEEDGDAIDLVGMLFDHLMKDVRPNSPAAVLLSKLQVPLLRVALQDKAFFTRQQHPARQMLNAIAETGAYWLGEEDSDKQLIGKMQTVVDRTVREFDGNLDLFNNLLEDLSSHLQTISRKAEVAEKRHVEAARGKERLALAREHAASSVEGLLKKQNLPRFTHTLLSQAWTDVMALTALRHGEDSDAWNQQLEVAERLIAVAKASPGQSPVTEAEAASLRQEIETSLSQVGYHNEEAAAIAQRLVDPQTNTEDESAASRTELTMRLKARARLGEDLQQARKKKVSLSAEEQARLEQIKHLPFGSWFEFNVSQGEKVRRRLSWFSTVTGHVLFVNHRGQKVGEHTLEGLAKAMVKGEVRVVEEEKGTLIDRAWSAVMNALRSFAGQTPAEVPAR